MTPNEQKRRLKLIQKKMKRVTRQTVSRLGRLARTNVNREIRKGTSLKNKDLKGKVSAAKINSEGTSATISYSPNQPSLRRFIKGKYVVARGGSKGGLRARVLGRSLFIKGAFLVTLPNGKTLPAISPRRGSLRILRGPSSRGALIETNKQIPDLVKKHFNRFVNQKFPIEWNRAVERHMKEVK